ncbi:General transcription factor 3C polypeptide 5, partial [Perkinsus olseni]
VSYLYLNGPWRNCYVRFGYDPKLNLEAVKYQVIDFRDPHFRSPAAAREHPSVAAATETKPDVHFRRPPANRSQIYQLCDIEDSAIQGVLEHEVKTNKLGKALDPTSGWMAKSTMSSIRTQLKCSVVVVHAEPAWSHLIRIPNSSAWLLFAYRDELPTDGGSTAQRSLLTAPPALYWVLWLALGLLYPAIFPFETIAVDYYVGDWGMTQQRAGMVVSTRPFWPLRSPLSSTVLTTVKGTQ